MRSEEAKEDIFEIKNDAPLVYLLNLTPSLLHKAFKAPQVLADQTTNIILSHPKQSDFDHSKTIKLLLPFLVLQRNDHSLYVRILLFYLEALYDLFHNKHLFFFKFLI